MLLQNLKSLFVTSVRFLILTFLCSLLVITSAFPAFATTSKPQEGETQLQGIQAETNKEGASNPMTLKDIQDKAGSGPNEVQGGADLEKQKNPGNSPESTSIEQQLKKGLNKITP